MARAQNPNIEILEVAAQALGKVCEDLVFLGGCATALLITDSAAPAVRVTRDVDTVAKIASSAEYYELGKRLRKCGFDVDHSKDAPLCRWAGHGIILDVMPTDEKFWASEMPGMPAPSTPLRYLSYQAEQASD